MATDPEIQQLLDAVANHPGSPAYALLAEHYVSIGKVHHALTVCRDGFAANPGYERGAVAYLNALRMAREHATAGDVFGRAVAFLPRSARLRVAWALILVEAGRDSEARRFAREALDLSPLDREARALLATLGASPVSSDSTREYEMPPPGLPASDPAGAGTEGIAASDPDDGPERGGALSEQAAALRPRVRPIGQRTTPHALFDLTPGPVSVGEPSLRTPSPFDITPSPVEEPAPPPPPGPPSRPSSTPPPPPPDALRPRPTPPPPPVQEEPTVPAAPSYPADMEQDGAAVADAGTSPVEPAITGPAPALDLPVPPRSRNMELTGPQQPVSLSLDQRRPKRRYWLWASIAALLLGGGGGGGYLVHRHLEEQEANEQLARAVTSLDGDAAATYAKTGRELSALHQTRPDDPRVASALALVLAHAVLRHGADAAGAKRARALLARPGVDAGTNELARAAGALLALQAGKHRQALAAAPLEGAETWHTHLVVALARLRRGEVEQALGVLSKAIGKWPAAVALRHQTARILRWRGEHARALKHAERGLTVTQDHGGLQVEQALLQALTGRSPAQPKPSPNTPRLRCLSAMVPALVTRRNSTARAAKLAAAAARVDPGCIYAKMWRGRWLLHPGGDADRALSTLEPISAAVRPLNPAFPVWVGRAYLRLGRPHEAAQVLQRVDRALLSEQDAATLQRLAIRIAHGVDDSAALAKRCAKAAKLDPTARMACVEAWLERSELKRGRRLMRSLRGPLLQQAWGLLALARGDTTRAVARLEGCLPKLPDRVPALIALARAHSRRGEPTRAIKLLREATRLDARSVRTRVMLGVALVAAGRDSEARTILEGVLAASPTQATILAHAGQAFLTLGLAKEAAATTKRAMQYNSASPPIQLLAARVALANRQQDEARALLDKLLARNPRSPEALMELGRIMAANNKPRRARRYLARALRIRPRDPGLLLLAARAHAAAGDYRETYALGRRAIRLLDDAGQDGKVVEAMIEVGKVLREGDAWALTKAEELLFAAAKPRSAPAAAYLELGKLYQRQASIKRSRKALASMVWSYRQAARRDPENAEAQLLLGRAALRLRPRSSEARRALRRYLKLRPRGEEADRVRTLVERTW